MKLEKGLHFCERGETWLICDDQHIAWFSIDDNLWIEASIVPGNYPGFNITVIESSTEKLAAHIQKVCAGWFARKCNIEGVELDEGSYVKDKEEENWVAEQIAGGG